MFREALTVVLIFRLKLDAADSSQRLLLKSVNWEKSFDLTIFFGYQKMLVAKVRLNLS